MFGSLIYEPKKYDVECLLTYLQENEQMNIVDDVCYVVIGTYDKTVIYCNGNAGCIITSLDDARIFSEKNEVNVVLFDYPGYGPSEGNPSEMNNVNALRSVIEDLNLNDILLLGNSIGTGVVLSYMYRFRDERVKCVHLISPFTCLSDVVSQNILFNVMFSALSSDIYDNMRNIQFVNCPIHIKHSHLDMLIPYTHSVKLYSRIQDSSKGSLLILDRGEHGTVHRIVFQEFLLNQN